jgi:hypothetical protein
MPETPDFEAIARRIFPVDDIGHDALAAALSAESRDHLVAQLRLVWNARGQADLNALDAEVIVMGASESVGFWTVFKRAVRQLDR